MDEEQEELSTYEASQKSGMSQGYLASLLRQHKLEGSYNSKQRRWMINAAALERFLTIEDKTGVRRITYAKRLQQRAQQAVQEGQLAQAEPLYLKALTFFDYFYGTECSESIRIRNDLGHLYCEQQRYKEAETHFLQALESVRDISLLCALLTNISNLYMVQNRFVEAEPYLRQKRNVVADYVQRVQERIGRARMLMDQQNYYEAARILMIEQDSLKYSEMLDTSTKSALYMTCLCLFILQDKQEDVHVILKQFQSVLFETGVEMGDAELLYQFAESLRHQRRYWEAKTFYHYALKLFEQDDKKPITQLQMGLVLKCLGQLYQEQENYPEAETAYLRALLVIESLRGIVHPDVAFILHSLVNLAVDQGNYRGAVPLLERAQLIERRSYPELDDRSAATMLYHDADRLLEQGELAEAEALLQRALTLDEQRHGSEHPAVIDDLTLLAHVLLRQEKLAEADTLARRALVIGEQQGENRAATTVIQMHLLDLITQAQGKEQEAKAFQRRVTVCNTRGPRSDDIYAVFTFHADALHAVTQGRYAEAEALLEHTLIVHEHVLGKEHRHVVLYMNQLAEIYCLQGKYRQAELLLIRVLALTKHVGSELPLLVATSLYQLAQFPLGQMDMTRAGRLAERAYREAEQIVGSDHVVAGIALTTKAHILFLQDKMEEAEEFAEQAKSILMCSQTAQSLFQLCAEQALAQIYNDIAQRKEVLALTDVDAPQCEKAEPLARRALREAERQLVVDHPLLMFFLHSLAAALASQKKYQEAETLYQRALMIAEQVLEPTHSFMLTLLKGLGHLYQAQEQYAFAELTFKRLLEICEQRGDQDAFRMSLLYQQIGLMCLLQEKTEEGRWYLERCSPLEQGDMRTPSSSKDSLSFLQEAMMDQSREKEI